MNNTIKLAVASALLAAASTASAAGGIVAGDWTLDIGGNVNAFYTHTSQKGAADSTTNITTGLLPNFLSVSGKTRQNDLDVTFLISIQPGAATSTALTTGSMNQRQAFLTFGDASWGSIKLGKDLGIYASDAILSDMTLLGVGAGAAGVGNTTLGRIGYGYQYADWKSQVAYTSPNFAGFSVTAGVTEPWSAGKTVAATATTNVVTAYQNQTKPAFEAKASYAFTMDAVSGKVWVSGITQNVDVSATENHTAKAGDVGATLSAAGFSVLGYYGQGQGTGMLGQMNDATAVRENKDWYTQATYTIPGVGTKVGVSYGESQQDTNNAKTTEKKNEMITFGVYHPLTKHLNLVAEYSEAKNKVTGSATAQANTVSAGAILFF